MLGIGAGETTRLKECRAVADTSEHILQIASLLIVLAGYATTTDGFGTAMAWLFTPDLAALSVSVMLNAMGHAFFTLAVGACALMAYGAYMPDHQSLPRAAVAVASLDVLVALLAGIAIFSVVFSQGMDPAEGPGLMFVTLPIAFAELPGGSIWLASFFLLLLLAAATTPARLLSLLLLLLLLRLFLLFFLFLFFEGYRVGHDVFVVFEIDEYVGLAEFQWHDAGLRVDSALRPGRYRKVRQADRVGLLPGGETGEHEQRDQGK